MLERHFGFDVWSDEELGVFLLLERHFGVDVLFDGDCGVERLFERSCCGLRVYFGFRIRSSQIEGELVIHLWES